MFLNPQFNDDLKDDYRRLGVRLRESRQVIIRNAAARLAAPLASIVDNDPRDPSVTLMISAVAMSTYRLLDPRRRTNATERALVGRVSELDLLETQGQASTVGTFGVAETPRNQSSRENVVANRIAQATRKPPRWSRLVHALPRISRLG